jgi:hypothetical protein
MRCAAATHSFWDRRGTGASVPRGRVARGDETPDLLTGDALVAEPGDGNQDAAYEHAVDRGSTDSERLGGFVD